MGENQRERELESGREEGGEERWKEGERGAREREERRETDTDRETQTD